MSLCIIFKRVNICPISFSGRKCCIHKCHLRVAKSYPFSHVCKKKLRQGNRRTIVDSLGTERKYNSIENITMVRIWWLFKDGMVTKEGTVTEWLFFNKKSSEETNSSAAWIILSVLYIRIENALVMYHNENIHFLKMKWNCFIVKKDVLGERF